MKANLIMTLLLLIVVSISCQKDESANPKDGLDYARVGQFHNEGLDFILNKLTSNGTQNKISKDQIFALNRTYGMEFIKRQNPDITEDQIKYIEEKLSIVEGVIEKVRANNSGRTQQTIYSEIMAYAEPHLTYNQSNYVNQILNVMVTQDYDINILQASLNQIETNINTLPVSERPLLLSTLSVARSSADYWNANAEVWQSEIQACVDYGEAQSYRTQKIMWGVVGAGDVAAATLTGVATSTALVVPFVGWGFWGACVGGAAVITSGAAILMML